MNIAFPRKHTLHFNYKNEQIPFEAWQTEIDKDQKIYTILFLGTVQIGKNPLWIIRAMPKNSIVIQGAPHWLARPGREDLLSFIQSMTDAALQFSHQQWKHYPTTVITDSRSTPVTLQRLVENNAKIHPLSVILIQPLGLNYPSLEQSPAKTLKKRTLKNLRHQLKYLPLDKKLRYNHYKITRMTILKHRPRVVNEQYTNGLSLDAMPYLKILDKNHARITIITGELDRLFPYSEIAQNLKANLLNIPLEIIPGIPHSPLASKQGRKLLTAAISKI